MINPKNQFHTLDSVDNSKMPKYLAANLIKDTLKCDEDFILLRLAMIRDAKNENTISHENAWK